VSVNPTTGSPHSGSQPLSQSSMMPGMPHLDPDLGHKCETTLYAYSAIYRENKKVVVVKAAGKCGLAAALAVNPGHIISSQNTQACYLHVQAPRSNKWPC
jgi:hypothetical protein